MRKIVDSVVDFNEPAPSVEVMSIIGSRYPNAMERCKRLKSALHGIYLAHHEVSLESMKPLGKREVRAFVEGLDDIPPYVASRVLQRCYDVHTIPVDDRLVDLLIQQGVLAEIVDAGEFSKWVSRQVKSADGLAVEATLRAFTDSSPKPPARKTPAAPKSKGKKVSELKNRSRIRRPRGQG